ncbi:P-loop containing nucleoside triphosphate hydrolase protein [Mycena sp. CBHHK59/15]|nr:P-loop containing nucleoside triphosphate hydrolase protein [Mycena sp. CBHHK59/15]
MSTPKSLSCDSHSSGSITPPLTDNHQSDHGVGFFTPSFSQGRRHMLDLVNHLHNTGVQIDIDLPQIAVIYSQSAGKSSLIESISGITLPRAARTCTSSLSAAPPRAAPLVPTRLEVHRRVALHHGQELPKSWPAAQQGLDKAELEDRIRRAQRAILNPSKPSRTVLEDEDETPEVSFTTNYISLQISGPEVADLSFVDLPGLIASMSSRGSNEPDIAMVECLVPSYISKPSCVIFLTVTCETDFENQGALHLTMKHDPEGKRIIEFPAATKSAGSRSSATSRKRSKTTGTAQLPKSETRYHLGRCARPRKRLFRPHVAMVRAGSDVSEIFTRTSNLIDRLSSILSDLISKRLPQIQIELENTIQKTRTGLQQLPKPPSSDPVGEVESLHQFMGELNNILEGVYHPEGLLQVIRQAQEQFRREIRYKAPDFRPFKVVAP